MDCLRALMAAAARVFEPNGYPLPRVTLFATPHSGERQPRADAATDLFAVRCFLRYASASRCVYWARNSPQSAFEQQHEMSTAVRCIDRLVDDGRLSWLLAALIDAAPMCVGADCDCNASRPFLFVLAYLSCHECEPARRLAFECAQLTLRTARDWFALVFTWRRHIRQQRLRYPRALRTGNAQTDSVGWGRALRRSFGAYYLCTPLRWLARDVCAAAPPHADATHRDALRLLHVAARNDDECEWQRQFLLAFAAAGQRPLTQSLMERFLPHEAVRVPADDFDAIGYVRAAQLVRDPNACPARAADAIGQFALQIDQVHDALLAHAAVLLALLRGSEPTAPDTLFACALRARRLDAVIGTDSERRLLLQTLCQALLSLDQSALLHPLRVLACRQAVVDCERAPPCHRTLAAALHAALNQSLARHSPSLVPLRTNKRVCVCIDVSVSMQWPEHCVLNSAGDGQVTALQAAACVALAMQRAECNASDVTLCVFAADNTLRVVDVQNSDNDESGNNDDENWSAYDLFYAALRDDVDACGDVDCALPMLHAVAHRQWHYDAFVIFTDNETRRRAFDVPPAEALRRYACQADKPNAKLVVCAMTSTGFHMAEAGNHHTLDIVGFDARVPHVIADFVAGRWQQNYAIDTMA